jgi:hypothetical protein
MHKFEFVSKVDNSVRIRYGAITFDIDVHEKDGKRYINRLDHVYFPPALYSRLVAVVLAQFDDRVSSYACKTKE